MNTLFKWDDTKKDDIMAGFMFAGLVTDINRKLNVADLKGFKYWMTHVIDSDDVIRTVNVQTPEVRKSLLNVLAHYYDDRGFEFGLDTDANGLVEKIIIKWL